MIVLISLNILTLIMHYSSLLISTILYYPLSLYPVTFLNPLMIDDLRLHYILWYILKVSCTLYLLAFIPDTIHIVRFDDFLDYALSLDSTIIGWRLLPGDIGKSNWRAQPTPLSFWGVTGDGLWVGVWTHRRTESLLVWPERYEEIIAFNLVLLHL